MKKGWVIGVVSAVILALFVLVWIYYSQEEAIVGCIPAGNVYQSPAGLGEIKGECCEGSSPIAEVFIPLTGGFNCEELSVVGGNSICSACGNGNCESGWENKCNCPEDCD